MTKLRFDLIGDIAIVRGTAENLEKMAESILQSNRRVKVVLAKAGPVRGDFRLCKLAFVAGERRTVTVHRENGCLFHVDLASVHFSPRLVTERGLVAEEVKPGETILNMFGGIGTFSIEMAQRNSSVMVFNVDINPEATRFCLKSVLANQLRGRVITVLGDAKETASILFPIRIDRILLPLPEMSGKYLPGAIHVLKRDGIIHYYDLIGVGKQESCTEVVLHKAKMLSAKYGLISRESRIVKSVAPRLYLVSLELQNSECYS